MVTLESLLKKVKGHLPAVNAGRLSNAYEFAAEAHNGQKRYSGEPYIVHPLETAFLLSDFRPDEDSIIAALLHDVSEDTEYSLDDIEKRFGKNVRDLVDGMEKLSRVRSYGDKSQIDNLQKMFLSMAKDFRVALIKLCDRLHNIRTLNHVPSHKQRRIAQETLEIYAPIAARLGIYRLKTALEDHAFRFIDKESYEEIEQQLVASTKAREHFIEEAKKSLRVLLSHEGFQAEFEGRVKGIYSIYRKMKRKSKTAVSDVFDVFAMRVVLPDIFRHGNEHLGHLYGALGVIHNAFTPLTNRFKDYVAVPKANGYRSLHTTVIGLGPKNYTQPTEVQLRNRSMHEQAEFGIAAHWLYDATKEKTTLIPLKTYSFENFENEAETSLDATHLTWLKELAKLKEDAKEGDEYIENLRLDVFQDRIFVFTPRGDVKDLPRGATPVDFAYAVHTEIGNRCFQAKVNGNIVPLSSELKNGNVVDIVIRTNARPHQNWLSFVKTNFAKGRIRSWFREQNREKNLKSGKDLLNQYLAKLVKPPLSPDLSLLKEIGGEKLNLQERENVLVEVGKGTMMVGSLVRRIFTLDEIIASVSTLRKRTGKILPPAPKKTVKKVILVEGHPNMPLRFPQCCHAGNQDEVKGFITRGKGVSIHKKNCRVFSKSDKARWVNVQWAETAGQETYRIKVSVDVTDRVGLLRDIGDAAAKLGFNIEDITQQKKADGTVQVNFVIPIQSFDELEKIFQTLEMIPNVNRAYLSES